MAERSNLGIALIGLGEVGQALAGDLRAAGVQRITSYDIAFTRADSPQLKAARALDLGIARDAPEAVGGLRSRSARSLPAQHSMPHEQPRRVLPRARSMST